MSTGALVLIKKALAQITDGRGPQPHEDRRFAPSLKVQRQRDQNKEECPDHVDSLATVHDLPPLGFVRCLPDGRMCQSVGHCPAPYTKAKLSRVTLPRTRVNKPREDPLCPSLGYWTGHPTPKEAEDLRRVSYKSEAIEDISREYTGTERSRETGFRHLSSWWSPRARRRPGG
jgi:hypothetical protein